MISVEMPNGTSVELLEDHEMLQVGTPQLTMKNKWSHRTLEVHFSRLPHGGQNVPAVLIRRQSDGRAVGFKITELAEAAERLMEAHGKERIIR